LCLSHSLFEMHLAFNIFVVVREKKITLVLILFSFILSAFGQLNDSKTLTFRVYDEENNDPVPFANIYFNHHQNGCETDLEGSAFYSNQTFISNFAIVEVSGFLKDTVIIDTQQNSSHYVIKLQRQFERTEKVNISLGINPAHKWLKLAQSKGKENDPRYFDNYETHIISKSVFTIDRITAPFIRDKTNQKLLKLFDTLTQVTDDTSKKVLPVFVSATASKYYHQKNPQREKELVENTFVRGIGVMDASFIGQVTGNALVQYNVYKPILQFLGKGILSPIAQGAKLMYRYKLLGVDKTDSLRKFIIRVSPRNKKDIAFEGNIWIQEKTGAILKLNLRLKGTTNINYIDRLLITQVYNQSFNSKPALGQSRVQIFMTEVGDNLPGINALNTAKLEVYKEKTDYPLNFFLNRFDIENSSSQNTADTLFALFDSSEKRILSRIDTIQSLPYINRSVQLLTFLVDGYLGYGLKWPVELGPYYLFGSYNPLEGVRSRIGFRTSYYTSPKWQLEAYAGYGFKDKKFKYGGKFSWHPSPRTGTNLKLRYSDDVELIGFTDNDVVTSGDALVEALNMFGSRNVSYCKTAQVEFNTDIIRGLTLTTKFSNRDYDVPQNQQSILSWYEDQQSQTLGNHLNNSTITTQLRYEPKVFYLFRRGRRKRVGRPGPTYTAFYTKGIPNVLGSTFSYQRVGARYDHRYLWGGIGRSLWGARYSKVLGQLPFPLLNLPLGNNSFILNNRSFNQMNLFEFVADESVQGYFEHHFNGFILNRIPVLNKLDWRMVLQSKAIYGSLRNENIELIPNQGRRETAKPFNREPFIEGGFGIENIFNFFRVDAIWRFSHMSLADANNFGIKASAFVNF